MQFNKYTDEKERSYSYHWQDENQNLILRWDNAPHHNRILTFPHHKHVKEKTKENFNIDCFSILKEISSLI
ncbi:MAG: toxin-antitoxin system TumE family protein [bacterium]